MPNPPQESVDDLFPRNAVSEVKSTSSEPENVAIQRLQNEGRAYFLVVSIAGVVFLVVLTALIYALFKSGTAADTQSKIVTGLIVAVSAAGGVLAGKKL
jgi:hypothetical protein